MPRFARAGYAWRSYTKNARTERVPRSLNEVKAKTDWPKRGISHQRNSQPARERFPALQPRSPCSLAGRRRARPTGRCACSASPTMSAITAASIHVPCSATRFGTSTTMAGRMPMSCVSPATMELSSIRTTRDFTRRLQALFDRRRRRSKASSCSTSSACPVWPTRRDPDHATARTRAPCILDRRLRRGRHGGDGHRLPRREDRRRCAELGAFIFPGCQRPIRCSRMRRVRSRRAASSPAFLRASMPARGVWKAPAGDRGPAGRCDRPHQSTSAMPRTTGSIPVRSIACAAFPPSAMSSWGARRSMATTAAARSGNIVPVRRIGAVSRGDHLSRDAMGGVRTE